MEKKETPEERLESVKEAVRKRRFRIICLSVGIAVVLAAVLVVMMPVVEMRRQVEIFYYGEDRERMKALRWLVENAGEEKSLYFMLEALKRPNVDESTLAYELLVKRFKDEVKKETLERLVGMWRDESLPRLSREHALFLLAEFGDKSFEPIFLEKSVWLKGSAWDAGCRYIVRVADEKTAERLYQMLLSDDVEERLAAAFALRFIRKKPFVRQNEKLRKALLALLKEDLVALREEAMETLWDWVREEDEEAVIAAMFEKDRRLQSARVRQFGALALLTMGAKHRVPLLLSLLSDGDGGVVEAAAKALKEFSDPSIIPKVRDKAFSDDSDTVVRLACLEILSAFDTPEAKSALVQMLYLDDVKVAHRLVRVLWRIADDGVVRGVTFALKRAKKPEIRAQCALLLGWLRRKELIDTLKKVAENDVGIVASSVASAFNYMLDEKALDAAMEIFAAEELEDENRTAMVSVLSFYRTPEALRRLIKGIGYGIERVREQCYFALNNIFSTLKELLLKRGRREPNIARTLRRLIEANTKRRLMDGLKECGGDPIKVYGLLLNGIKELPLEFKEDRRLLWNAVSLLLDDHHSRRLLEWFLKEKNKSRTDTLLLIKRFLDRLSEFDRSIDAYKNNKVLAEELLKMLELGE